MADDNNEDDTTQTGLASPDGSTLARIKARRDERLSDESLRLEIPTWDGDLIARYKVLRRNKWEEIIKRSRKDVGADLDFIAQACIGIIMRDPESGEHIELQEGGEPIRFDERLARMLDFTPPDKSPVRAIVMYMFKGNDVSTAAHAATIARWMTNTSAEVADAVVGE